MPAPGVPTGADFAATRGGDKDLDTASNEICTDLIIKKPCGTKRPTRFFYPHSYFFPAMTAAASTPSTTVSVKGSSRVRAWPGHRVWTIPQIRG